MFRLEFDGLFRTTDDEQSASAGIMCYGWRILRGKRVIAQGHGTFARGRNANSNIAEYLALVEGLEALRDMGVTDERVLVCGDAKSVINQMERAGRRLQRSRPPPARARPAAGLRLPQPALGMAAPPSQPRCRCPLPPRPPGACATTRPATNPSFRNCEPPAWPGG